LNVILAERYESPGNKDIRNGAGKTTLVNVIHFCLGVDVKKIYLPVKEIESWNFYIEIILCGKEITAKRSIKNPNYVVISGDISDLPVPCEKDKESGEFFL
jgi:uncharacterized protein YydD (DUF2326 family)